eukprot:m.166292 g.166292  ORF g.166292 m.166292 type:complete len:675 (+) comp17167_c0_seq1:106-2130(+)
MFRTFLATVSELLAPTPQQQDSLSELKYHWKEIADYVYLADDTANGKERHVDDTEIPDHFAAIVDCIVQDEQTVENDDETGKCLEYMLGGDDILRAAVMVGQSSHPKGILHAVQAFFADLLRRTRQKLIPQSKVNGPLKKLIMCTEQRLAKPHEAEEEVDAVRFLCAICGKIADDNTLIHFFVENPQLRKGSVATTPPSFPLLSALVSLVGSKDEHVSSQACEGIIACLSVHADSLVPIIVNYTDTCRVLADTLGKLFSALPMQADEACRETMIMLSNFSHMHDDDWHVDFSNFSHLPLDAQAFVRFMSWVRYCDHAANCADPLVAKELASALSTRFLRPIIAPRLLQPSEAVSIMTTGYITAYANEIYSPALRASLVSFLVDEHASGELAQPLGSVLIARCDDMSDEVSTSNLLLFWKMLSMHTEQAFVALALSHTRERGITSEVQGDELAATQQLVDGLLNLLPPELKTDDEAESYRNYFEDTQESVRACFQDCAAWTGPGKLQEAPGRESPPPESPSSEAGDRSPVHRTAMALVQSKMQYVCDSPLVNVLLHRLQRLAHQPRSINLVVSGICATLLTYPHPTLHDALLSSSGLSIVTALKQAAQEIKARAERVPSCAEKVKARRLVLSRSEEDSAATPEILLLDAIILLEEICKELAAVVLVKSNALLTQY